MVVEVDDVAGALDIGAGERLHGRAGERPARQPHRRGRLRQRLLRAGRRVRGRARQAAHLRPQPALRRDRPVRGREHGAGTCAAAEPDPAAGTHTDSAAEPVAEPAARALTASGADPTPTPPPANEEDILWTGDAEKPWDDSVSDKRWPDNNEWVSFSCEDRSRFSQVEAGAAQGKRAYRIEVHDGDDSYGERCELDNGNTSASRLHHQMLFHEGQEVWIAFQTYLPLDFSFAVDGAPVSFPNDGGLITQIKQLGSCGTPALGIVSGRTVFALRNSAAAHCESGPMRSLWKVPMVLGRWVKWMHHIRFSTDPQVGFIATWYDPDGLGLRPIPPTLDFGHRVIGNRIYTHTQKAPTGHPDPACPADDVCSHARIGIYRDQDVSGTSVVYHDGWTVARTRAAAVGNAFSALGARHSLQTKTAALSGGRSWGSASLGEGRSKRKTRNRT